MVDARILNEEIQKLLEADPSNPKSHKPKANSYGVSKECSEFLKAKGFKNLNVLPQSFVKPSDIIFNPELATKSKDTVWVCKFPAMTPSGDKVMKIAYTRNYMKRSQIKKYKKISKISEKDIGSLDEKTLKYMSNKDSVVADAACVLRIILKTGLRIGSLDDNETGNVGVRTLSAKNISIKGNTIRLQFIGKSYQENIAEFEDKDIADYLSKKLTNKKPEDKVFDCSYSLVGKLMKKVNPKKVNPKDLRTYKATEYAQMLLNKTLNEPLPENPKEIKKTVKDRLKNVFEQTAAMLNNSAAMAKNSYIKPSIITDYLSKLGLEPKTVGYKHLTLESVYNVYHGTNANFRKFDLKKTAQGILWFSNDKDKIKRGDAGANGSSKILHCEIKIDNPAGWDEYEKLTLWELETRGYDGIILPDGDSIDYVVFSPEQVKIVNRLKESSLPLFDENLLPDWWDDENVVLVKKTLTEATYRDKNALSKTYEPIFTEKNITIVSKVTVDSSLQKMLNTANEYYQAYLKDKEARMQRFIEKKGSSKAVLQWIDSLNKKTERAYNLIQTYIKYANEYNKVFQEYKDVLLSSDHHQVREALQKLHSAGWDNETTNYYEVSGAYKALVQIKSNWKAEQPLIDIAAKCFKVAQSNRANLEYAQKLLFKSPAQMQGAKKNSAAMRARWGE